jgi:hypothetical protein
MTKPWRPHSNVVPFKRLRGLDEFETPEFVGRLTRMERLRKRVWAALAAGAIVGGLAIGLAI